MTNRFTTIKPLQALKLAAILGTLLLAILAAYALIPLDGFSMLLFIPALGVAIVVVVAAETLVSLYRAVRADVSIPEQLTVRPAYSIVCAIEVAAVFLGPYGIVYFVASIPEPRGHPGPAGVGLLFIVVGLTFIILGGALICTLVEYYYFRRTLDTRPNSAH